MHFGVPDALLALGGRPISGRSLLQAERADASIGGHALAMLNWHDKNMFSGVSGAPTLPIEAALIATDTAPGLIRAPPPLRRWADADPTLWPRLVDEARAARRPARAAILANDVHPAAIALAPAVESAMGGDADESDESDDV